MSGSLVLASPQNRVAKIAATAAPRPARMTLTYLSPTAGRWIAAVGLDAVHVVRVWFAFQFRSFA